MFVCLALEGCSYDRRWNSEENVSMRTHGFSFMGVLTGRSLSVRNERGGQTKVKGCLI